MEMRETWKDHPLYKTGKIELVPTEWVWQYWGADVSPDADLMDGTLVDLEGLWRDLREHGMHEPLIMRIGLTNKKFRLESGNHRIQVLHAHQVPFIPVTVQVREICDPFAPDAMTDATLLFDANNDFLITAVTDEYMKPSEVFRSLAGVARPA